MERIVQVGRLGEFLAEVTPYSDVRVMEHYSRTLQGVLNVETLALDVMGYNRAEELVWWHYGVEVQLTPGSHEPWTDHGKALAQAWPALTGLLMDYLEEGGYRIQPGRYATPNSITPLLGALEIAVWDAEAGRFARVEVEE